MNTTQLYEIVTVAKKYGAVLLNIKVPINEFKELKESAYECAVQPSDMPSTEIMCYGVRVSTELCTCGAHPEDWE